MEARHGDGEPDDITTWRHVDLAVLPKRVTTLSFHDPKGNLGFPINNFVPDRVLAAILISPSTTEDRFSSFPGGLVNGGNINPDRVHRGAPALDNQGRLLGVTLTLKGQKTFRIVSGTIATPEPSTTNHYQLSGTFISRFEIRFESHSESHSKSLSKSRSESGSVRHTSRSGF